MKEALSGACEGSGEITQGSGSRQRGSSLKTARVKPSEVAWRQIMEFLEQYSEELTLHSTGDVV